MPHINRIRVNNIKYNFGTQFYDDFVLRFSGKNTIYDLANGGGKSVLMLLMLQNMIPNCTLDEKQPIEKLFRTGSGSSTIHSLIEWQLNKDDIKNGYKYMTTGFCARKARENATEDSSEHENAAIEYFNYVIFYREFNDNDIKNLPLSNGKERITYHGLKNYLKELEHKDYSLIVKIFERKGEYQQFISKYGIYESEWEIIRGINKTEGHVRTYFESNYKTTRKVVEDLLIEEIIQKSYYNSTGEGADFAKLLLDIKNKLVELTKKKKDINNYDRQMEVLNSFIGRLQALKGMYHKKGGIETEFVYAYNTCLQCLEELKEALEQQTAQRQEFLEEKKEKEFKVETALVQVEEEELQKLDNTVETTKELLEGLEQQLLEEKAQLLFKENTNDYLEYVEYKKEYEAAKLAVETQGKEEEAEKVLAALSAAFQKKSEEELQHLKEQLFKEKEVKEELENQKKQQTEELQKEEEALSLKKSRVLLRQEETAYYLKSLEELKKNTSLLLYEEAMPKRKQLAVELEQLQQHRGQLSEEIKRAADTMIKDKMRLSTLKEQEKYLLNRQETLGQFLKEQGIFKEKLERLREFYQEREEKQLKDTIYKAFQNNTLEIQNLRQDIKELRANIKAYEKGILFPESEKVQAALEIINTGRQRALTGFEYLKQWEKEKQEELLEVYPSLPYAIVVNGDYQSIQYDKKLKKLGETGTLIPIINGKALEGMGEELYKKETLDFLIPESQEFLSQEHFEKLLKTAISLLEEKEKKLLLLEERSQLMKADISYMEEYETKYLKPQAQNIKEYEDNKLQLKDIEAEQERILNRQNEVRNKKEQYEAALSEENEKQKELETEEKAISEIATLYNRYGEKEIELISLKNEVRVCEKEIITKRNERSKAEDSLEISHGKCQTLQHTIDAIIALQKEISEDNYEQEIPEDYLEFIEFDQLSLEELEIKFKGYKTSFLEKNSDLADKKKLIENYRQQMEKSLRAIEYRNGELSQFQLLYESHELTKTTLEELRKYKEKISETEEKIAVSKKQLEASSEAANRKFGSIAHGKTLVEEKYGYYKPLQLSGQELLRFISEYKNLTHIMEEKIKDSEKKEKELEKEISSKENIKEDMLYMMESAGIDYSSNQGVLEDESTLKETYKELKMLYEKIMKEEHERRETFEKDKNRLKETLLMTNAHELAGEVEKHIDSPSNEAEADALINNIQETISCIELEKAGVEKGIMDMEKIKQNFESQCLQTCVNIKSALDRLPKLSGIQLDDKTVPMITLSIPYIKEELYEDSMSNYIDHVIETADSFATETERVKYIRNQLAWKKLFSVIVKDMNLIKLNLYKRERIKEQSRYLKYEEAVGSTGQSQGIYIQFLVAIIHYITSMNSANSDPLKLKNVIFIDNPFGAAKDVYIWEPIFKLLKANNVQLIVPARGATPAITGRFEVNYILGQKLIDGRQQTVVVDYRSQTEQEELEYTSLSYEQNTLNFE